ncbi:MAG: DUF2848 domain-containing protein [Austwickia sp.]|nr:DUF2848 domain-containing protein [Actinomycetota bacterium]MCB1254689.1 DUF2848 family protein [Austwickia sp.]MCO5309899.1 DUF2848 domain-containing protein [Austwickia sp.]
MLRFRVIRATGARQDVTVQVSRVLNGGYAGRDTAQVQAHIDELAELGIPGPQRIPTMYPLSDYLAVQGDRVAVPHGRTSGEAEWALVVPGDATGPEDYLVTAACDHTDRALERHGVAWSKQSAPDFLGDVAWRWGDVAQRFDGFTLRAWVRGAAGAAGELLIQDGTPAQLLGPAYWIDRLGEAALLQPGTVFMSGTIPMIAGVDQFAAEWRVELADGAGAVSRVGYRVEQLPPAWD